jgi:hypothetical protein
MQGGTTPRVDLSGITAAVETPKRTAAELMRAAEEQAEAKRAIEATALEQKRLADLLSRHKCFYRHNDEVIGPVSLWNVREIVESELLTPDVPVILEGADFWYNYAEQELRVAPPPNANLQALHAAAKLTCSYLDRGQVAGPLSLLSIFHMIRSGRLPSDVQISVAGTHDWKRACDV